MSNSNLRYERKYVLDNPLINNIENYLLTHPAGFSVAYPQRQVNSLYFDSPTLKNYQASLDGQYNRVKPRIRWYGNTRSTTKGKLELKIKTGELGYKKIGNQSYLNGSLPTLLTSYTRQYYLSANKRIRLTIDQNIKYTNFLNQLKSTATDPRTIVEIKYAKESEIHALSIPQFLPLTLCRFSKYVTGIEYFL